ncbi:response regulator transcription factor [Flaviaesturariibacter amylovorans]|uniref:HTH luxR-type domain-containing protein n=1 Tax=Flaviaesturariibacter amylovorans TaxID=1084520 RepID=A0ABP8GAX7_9BACT
MRSVVLGFGGLILLLLLFFRLSALQLWRGEARLEVVVAGAAVLFFCIGVFVNRRSLRSQAATDTPVAAPAAPASLSPDAGAAQSAGLTARELEVLQKMAEGLSNAEIGAALFLSESTIKTHVSNILFKLDAKRRTAAVQAARARGILF